VTSTNLIDMVPLVFRAGDDRLLQFTVVDANGAPVNISGMTPHFVAARGETQLPAVISTDSGPPTATATITSAPGGVFTVSVDKSVTVSLLGSYEWQASLTDASGRVACVARGTISFRAKLS